MPRRNADVDLDSRIPQIELKLRPMVDEAASIGAHLVEARAKQLVPVGATGNLRDSIHVEDEGEGDQAVVAGDTTGDNNVFYGHMVEFGTMNAGPRPFLIPALEVNRIPITKIVSEALDHL